MATAAPKKMLLASMKYMLWQLLWWGVCKTIPHSVLTTLAFGLLNGGQETSILDIGALHAGQFFGEVSFLFHVYKSMSSMCFLPLSEFFHYFMIIWVSVLRKWWRLAEHLGGLYVCRLWCHWASVLWCNSNFHDGQLLLSISCVHWFCGPPKVALAM